MSMTNSSVILVTYWARLFEQTIMLTLHYRFFTSGTPTDTVNQQLAALASKLGNIVTPVPLTETLRLCTPQNVRFDRITCQQIKPTRSVYAENAFEVNGTLADDAITANVCASITKRTFAPGRKGVGHAQWPPLGAAMYLNGVLDVAYRTGLLTDFAEAMEQSITVGAGVEEWDAIPVLPQGGPDGSYDIQQCTPRSTVRTMHRRTVGLGI